MYLESLEQALRPAIEAGAVIDRVTLWPWVVATGYMLEDAASPSGWRYAESTRVEWATHSDRPDAETFVPAGATFAKGEVFPASRFDDMPVAVRRGYLWQYKCWLMARKARALEKPVADLQPWVDYDAVHIDESAQRWASGPGVRFAGD